jgi:capsular polysaccharide biosynthesis protein
MLGITDQTLTPDDECVTPERYFFCSPTAMTGAWNPLGWDWLRNKFSPYFGSPNSGQPIFFTRRGSTRTPQNISEIEEIFASYNFLILDCGNISVKEQIRLSSIAPFIAGIHGGAMTNILWSQPKTRVLELFNQNYTNACYEQIAFQGKLNYKYLILNHSNSLSEIKMWLKKLFL